MNAPPPSKLTTASVPAEVASSWTVGTLSYTRRGLGGLFFWLLWGDFAWATNDRVVPQLMQMLFKKYDLSDTMMGLLYSSVPITLVLLFVPVMGYLSDRHRGGWGRRIPFIFAITPLIVVSVMGLAFSTQLAAGLRHVFGAALSPNHSILIFLGMFCISYQFLITLANTLYAALVNDVVPQPLLGRFFGLFRVVTLGVAIGINYWLLGKAEAYYFWFFLCIGCLYGAGYTLMCLKVKEGEYPKPPPQPRTGWHERLLFASWSYLKTAFGNKYYLWYFAAFVFTNIVYTPVNLYSVFFAKSVNMSMDAFGKYQAYSFVISLVLSYPLGYLADRLHPLRMAIGILAGYLLTMLWAFFYVKDAHTFGFAIIGHCVFSGGVMTVLLSLPQRLLPRAQFAQMAAAGWMINSLITVILAPILGMLLDCTHHAYHYTFLVGAIVAVLALFSCLVLHSKFMALGGPKNYIAPE